MATNNSLDQVLSQCQTILAQCVVSANEAVAAVAFLVANAPAPINSPAFTGIPTAPTAAQNNNSSQLATTAYLDRLLAAANGIPTLDNTGHIPTVQLPSSVLGGLAYQGVWDASTNTPTIVSGTGTNGYFYVVNVAGTTDIDGISSWAVGDWIVYQDGGTNAWEKVSLVYTPVTGITLASLAVQATHTFVANATGSSASPTAISVTQATALLNVMAGDTGSGGTKGLVPAPAAGNYAAGYYLDAGGNWSEPPGQVSPGDLAAYALLDSPAFVNNPTAPTLAVDTNSTGLATTEFVLGQAASANPVVDGIAAPGTSTRYARADHVHPTDTSRAPTASPTFTGTPLAPTPGSNVNTTQVPTCAWVNTYFATLAALAAYATLASPVLTGSPTAPTQSASDNSTKIATTAMVQAAIVASPQGQPIPASSSDYGVGIVVLCLCVSVPGSSLANNATTVGSTLSITFFQNGIGFVPGVTPSGTWKNISGQTLGNGDVAYFVRTA